MRHAAFALLLLATPALAKDKAASKTPKEGQFCSKKQAGSTVTDAKGQTLTCRAGKKGKLHWEK
jgi:hypothetical protein